MSEVKDEIIKQLDNYELTQELQLENILQNQQQKEYLIDSFSQQDDKFKNFGNELIMKIMRLESENENQQIEINEENIKNILNCLTKNVKIERISSDTFKIILEDNLQAYLVKTGFEDLNFDDVQLKISIEQVPKVLNSKKNYSPKKWSNEINNQVPKKKHSDSLNLNSQQNQSNKFTCRYDVTIENDKNFQVAKKIIGSGGCNMKRIIENTIRNRDQEELDQVIKKVQIIKNHKNHYIYVCLQKIWKYIMLHVIMQKNCFKKYMMII